MVLYRACRKNVVEIFPGAERPYYIKSQGVFDGTYVRVAGTTRHVEDYMLRELIANAVAHCSYLEPGNIQVALYDDRLEITSPGMLQNNVTIEKMIEGYSRPRNPAIARAFAYMKIIEKWGTGIPRLFAACEEYGLPKPELIDFDGDFRVNMYRKRDANTETNIETNTENVGRIIRLMGEQPSITVKMIAQQLGLSVGGVRYHINKLKKDGVVEHIGSSKKGTWVIHD